MRFFYFFIFFCFFFLNSCGGSSDFDFTDNSKENVCKIGVSKRSVCDPGVWVDDYDSASDYIDSRVDSCITQWNNDISDEIVSDSEECENAWLAVNKCMYNLTCEQYNTTVKCFEENLPKDEVCLCSKENLSAMFACYQ